MSHFHGVTVVVALSIMAACGGARSQTTAAGTGGISAADLAGRWRMGAGEPAEGWVTLAADGKAQYLELAPGRWHLRSNVAYLVVGNDEVVCLALTRDGAGWRVTRGEIVMDDFHDGSTRLDAAGEQRCQAALAAGDQLELVRDDAGADVVADPPPTPPTPLAPPRVPWIGTWTGTAELADKRTRPVIFTVTGTADAPIVSLVPPVDHDAEAWAEDLWVTFEADASAGADWLQIREPAASGTFIQTCFIVVEASGARLRLRTWKGVIFDATSTCAADRAKGTTILNLSRS